MEKFKNNTKKFCSFYVSNVHLVTMLIPYLSKQIQKGNNFIIFTEEDLKEDVDILLSKITLKEEEKEKIKQIDWNSYSEKEKDIEMRIIKRLKEEKNIEIVINGNEEYIENINKIVERILEQNNIKIQIRIINCYEVMQFNQNMQEILDKHDKVLNTSGEKDIDDIFQGYKRKMA